jgi:hypothetical protein
MFVPAGVEEAQFRPTANGWIFSAPNPCLFGRRRCYIVDDLQKAELAPLVRRGRYYRVLALIPLLVLLFATLFSFPTLIVAPSLATLLVLALLMLINTVVLNLCDWLPLQPLLPALPRTAERIGFMEMHGRQAQSMSVKALSTIAAIQVLACVFNLGLWVLSPRANAYLLAGVACMGLTAAYFLAMLLAKVRAQRAPA